MANNRTCFKLVSRCRPLTSPEASPTTNAVKILLLSQWFEPEPFHKGLAFAKELQRNGHQVSVLTGFPNYPGGKIYPGYRQRLFAREVMEGIPVTRVPLYPSHDRSALRRMLCYASFAFSSLCAIFLLPRPDVVYAYGPPPTAALAAVALRIVRKVPFLFDDTDLWPDTLGATGMVNSERLLRIIRWWVDYVYRSAAHVTVLASGYKARLIERGIPADHVSVLPNWGIEEAATPVDAAPAKSGGTFTILFAGNMGPAQDLPVVLEAAHRLKTLRPDIRFLFAGSGVDAASLEAQAEKEGLDNVSFLGRLAPRDMPPIFAAADALLVHLRDEPMFAFTVPSKTQSYLQAGKPILMGVRGDAADMVAAAGAGIAFQPGNPEALATAAVELADMPLEQRTAMGLSGRRYYAENLSCAVGTRRFLKLFEDAVRRAHAA